jgi:serine/threonine protein kinase
MKSEIPMDPQDSLLPIRFTDDIIKTGRLNIDESKPLSIAAKVLGQEEGRSNLQALQNRSGFSWYNRHVTVKYGTQYLDINIRSCAKRLGISKERVFELAKLESFDTFKSLIQQERASILTRISSSLNVSQSSTSTDNPVLLLNAIYLLRQPLTNALENKHSYSKKIHIANDTYVIKVENAQDQWKIKLQKTNSQSPQEVELQDCFVIATKKDPTSFKVNSKTLMSTLKENEVSTAFSLQDLDRIKKFVSKNRDRFTKDMILNGKKTFFIRPNKENELPRALQFNSDGSVYIHFSRIKKGDKLLGKGGFKKAKFALDLISGDLLVAGKMNTSRVSKVTPMKEAEILQRFKEDPGIAQLIEFVDQDDVEEKLNKTTLKTTFGLSQNECISLMDQIRSQHTQAQLLIENKRKSKITCKIERTFELSKSNEGKLQIKPKDSTQTPIVLNFLNDIFKNLKTLKLTQETEKTNIKTKLKGYPGIPEDENYQSELCNAIYRCRQSMTAALKDTTQRWPRHYLSGANHLLLMKNLDKYGISVTNGKLKLEKLDDKDNSILTLDLDNCFDLQLDNEEIFYGTQHQQTIQNNLRAFNLSPSNYAELTRNIFDFMYRSSYEAPSKPIDSKIDLPFEITKEDRNITISPKGDTSKKVDLTDFAISRPKVIFLQPFYNQGDLQKFLENKLNLKTKKMLAHQMLSACATVNKKGIIHCDIKPQNFFVNKDKDGNITCKLADFGLAQEKEGFQHTGGTLPYYSPELTGSTQQKEMCEKIDAWALGVTLFNLFHPQKEDPAWTKGYQSNIITALKNLTQDMVDIECQKLPQEIQPLIKSLLKVKPEKRLSAETAFENFSRILI